MLGSRDGDGHLPIRARSHHEPIDRDPIQLHDRRRTKSESWSRWPDGSIDQLDHAIELLEAVARFDPRDVLVAQSWCDGHLTWTARPIVARHVQRRALGQLRRSPRGVT